MDDFLEFLFKILFLILFILLLPAALLIATPFIFLIPGKEHCTTCGEINCDCGASKVKEKRILKRYGKIFGIWAKTGFWA